MSATQKQLLRPHIELIVGPMFAGKSTELLRLLKRHEIAHRSVYAIKHVNDKRNGADRQGLLNSRDGAEMRHAVVLDALSAFDLRAVANSVIGVDEIQFFDTDDAREFCEEAVAMGNIVIFSGLSSTHERKAWPTVAAVEALAESVTRLSAICCDCGEAAAFTVKVGGDFNATSEVGGEAKYLPMCETDWRARVAARTAWHPKRSEIDF